MSTSTGGAQSSPSPGARTLAWLRTWADWLDGRYRIPGTSIRFGFDPILSLIPGIGDLATPVFTALLLAQGLVQRVPKVILLRMVINALADALIGAVPVAGTIGDIFWRANLRNLDLLERHAQPGRAPRPADYAFVFGLAFFFAMLAAVPAVLALVFTVILWQWIVG